jgi:hypothetical protein
MQQHDPAGEQPLSQDEKAQRMDDMALRVTTRMFNAWLERGLPAGVIANAAASAGLTLMASLLSHDEMVDELRAIAERLDQLNHKNVAGNA